MLGSGVANARGRSRAWRKKRGPSFWVTLAGLDQQLLPSAAIPSRSSHWILNSVCCFPKARKTGFTLSFPAANISTSPSFHLWGLAPGPKRSLLQLRDASMIRAASSPEFQLLRTPPSSSWIVAVVQFLSPSLPFATPRTADCRTPDFPVLYYLPEFPQTHVHWCHATISSSVIPFSCLQPFPASGSFPAGRLFASGEL